MKTLPLILTAILCTGLALLAWLQHSELASLRARLEEMLYSQSQYDKKLAAAEANVRELAKQLEEARHPVLASKTETNALGGNARPSTLEASLAAMLPGLANFMDRPGLQKMMALQQRNLIERRYQQLLKKLNLSPVEAEKFKALLVEREATAMETVLVAAQKGLNPMQNPGEIQQLVASGQAETDEQIRQTLGPDAYQQYLDYRSLEPQRNTVAQLQQSLGYSDAPLNASQAEQLTQLLASSKNNSATQTTPGRSPAPLITEQVLESSRSFLSPTQVQGLAELKQQQEALAAARLRLLPTPAPDSPTPVP